MSDIYSHVTPGQPIRPALTAARVNSWIDTARKARRDRDAGAGRAGYDSHASQTVCYVRNDTGADLPVHSVLGLGDLLLTESMLVAQDQPLFAGLAPSNAHPIPVIAIVPIASGAIGRAAIQGVVPVRIDVADPDHGYAAPTDGETGYLTSGTGGPAQILWREEGTGPVQAVVLLGGGGGIGSLVEVIEINGPEDTAGYQPATILRWSETENDYVTHAACHFLEANNKIVPATYRILGLFVGYVQDGTDPTPLYAGDYPGSGAIPGVNSFADCDSVSFTCPPLFDFTGTDEIPDWVDYKPYHGGGGPETPSDHKGYGNCKQPNPKDCKVKTSCIPTLIPGQFLVLITSGTGQLSYYADNSTTVAATYNPISPSGWYFTHTSDDNKITINGRFQCCGDDDANLYFIGSVTAFDPFLETTCGCEDTFSCACLNKQSILQVLTTPTPTEQIRLFTACGTVDLFIMPQPVCVPPAAHYSANPVSGYAPLYVDFTDSSVGSSPMTYRYEMGDGAEQLTRNPSYVYMIPGTYNTALTVKNGCGQDTDTGRVVITVLQPPRGCQAEDGGVCIASSDTSVSFSGPGCPSPWQMILAVAPDHGVVGFDDANNVITYTPSDNPHVLPDQFKYQLLDGNGNYTRVATVLISECYIS